MPSEYEDQSSDTQNLLFREAGVFLYFKIKLLRHSRKIKWNHTNKTEGAIRTQNL